MKKCPKCGLDYPDSTTLCPADGVALETTDDPLIGKTLAGKYRIDARLSAGGMGNVYRGTHILMEKTVAIKVLRPSLAADEKIVARFSREARAASRISHPNALSVTDFGEDENGIVFLVMEYLSGKTLKQVIREVGPLPLNRAVEIMRQVGDALQAAHAQNVVHRDLKSDNIMLQSTASGDHAKVLDFGIAKINEPDGEFDAGLTAPNLVMGTPQYMSPEQCSQDSEIDARSDIYSFGIILYEMLAGHVPFTGESPTIIMVKHLQEPVPSVLDERSDVPASVGRVVARAMAKVPGNRYQTVGELLEDLTIAAGMSVLKLDSSVGTSSVSRVDDVDEVTMVRPRVDSAANPPASQRRAPLTVPIGAPAPVPTPPSSSLNLAKILIPSAVALVVVFAVIYAFTGRNTATPVDANANQQPSLVADPNSKPVQAAQPPTGKGEEGIPAGGIIDPVANANANVSPNVNAAISPVPIEEVSPPPNTNSNENANSNRKAPAVPEPSRNVTPESVPAPPGSTKSPEVKPSPSPVASPGGRE